MGFEKPAAALLALLLLTGCAAPAEDTSRVASAEELAAPVALEIQGEPVPPSALREGSYRVAVDCSSSMFRVTDCRLTVAGDAMEAELTLSSGSYGYLYLGTAEEAAAAGEKGLIPAGESPEGHSTFVLPVEALDRGISCAAWSRNKEKWYDRTLVFRSDSLPLSAFARLVTAASMAEGDYRVAVTLSGGSGKAAVASPALLRVEQGKATAELVWSSDKYDYMVVEGETFYPELREGHAVFRVPVAAFDRPLGVKADTTAMSKPYEIDYTLTFDSTSLEAAS